MFPEVFSRYWHTLRFLKFIQIYRRIWFRIYRPSPLVTDAPAVAEFVDWQQPATRNQVMSDPLTFNLHRMSGNLDEIGWEGAERSRLWRYNQHYFDDLNAQHADHRSDWHRRLLSRWIKENPPGAGTGWEPYPTSLRIVNWIKWDLRQRELGLAGLGHEHLQSLATQVRLLRRRIEWHLLGNHLLANAKALIFCGIFFESAEAEEWASLGTRIITKELEEQVLADGGHFELSPMYHSLILEDFLDLINLVRSFRRYGPGETFQIVECDLRRRLESVVPGMLNWLDLMSHPDGDISFFNDAAFDVVPKYSELLSYASRLQIEPTDAEYARLSHLENSGYIRIADDRIYALIDVASIGPDYLPGHAHADTLSFELSIFEQRVFVNSGTSVYDPGEIRLYERGTLAHNSIAIDGHNSSEVWSSFRVGRRASILGLEIEAGVPIKIVSSHDGYSRIKGGPVHQRTWVCFDRSLEILDSVSGDVQNAFAYFHIHPATTLIPESDSVRLLLTSGEEALFRVLEGEFQIAADTWCPRFGERVDTFMIIVKLKSNTSLVSISW